MKVRLLDENSNIVREFEGEGWTRDSPMVLMDADGNFFIRSASWDNVLVYSMTHVMEIP